MKLDAAFAPDPTVNQQALRGDAFGLSAPRVRAGRPASIATPQLVVDPRNRALSAAICGLRLSGGIGRLDVAVLALRGPEGDPLLLPAADEGPAAVRPAFPCRTPCGRHAGASGWCDRLAAGNGPCTRPAPQPACNAGWRTERARRPRTIVGGGLDWQAPAGLFLNAQLIPNHLAADDAPLAQPDTDIFATFRAHRDFARETVRPQAEVLPNLAEGDALLRPSIDWRWTTGRPLRAGPICSRSPRMASSGNSCHRAGCGFGPGQPSDLQGTPRGVRQANIRLAKGIARGNGSFGPRTNRRTGSKRPPSSSLGGGGFPKRAGNQSDQLRSKDVRWDLARACGIVNNGADHNPQHSACREAVVGGLIGHVWHQQIRECSMDGMARASLGLGLRPTRRARRPACPIQAVSG
ncbi:MAG: hypothetical protein SNJ79_03675 [Sphingomonadaceae bacterium]